MGFLLSCGGQSRDTVSQSEYEVYTSALPQLVLDAQDRAILWAIHDSTVALKESDAVPRLTDTTFGSNDSLRLPFEMVKEFNSLNSKRYALEKSFPDSFRIVLLDTLVQRKIRGNGGMWDGFYKTFPDAHAGAISLSRVAFDPAEQKAVLYWSFMRHHLWGGGEYALLQKRKDHWELIARRGLWVS